MNKHLLIQHLKQLPRVSQKEATTLESIKEGINELQEMFRLKEKAESVAAQAVASLSQTALSEVTEKATDLVNAFNTVLSPIEKMNRTLGTSTIVSSQIFRNFQNIAESAEGSLLSQKEFFNAAADLNALLPGTTALFSRQTDLTNEILDIQTRTNEQLGVGAGNAAAFNTFLLAGKESAESVLDELTETASTIEVTTGQTGVLRDMLDAVGATSADTRMAFRGTATELAKSALQANRMGTTLDQVAQSAKSMLNVESQIASEMEFQLLTGKNISQQTNEMRVAAMTGDMDEQLRIQGELIEQNYESLKGNPIAMEAFAKTIGLSTEQVAKQAETIKARNKLIDVAGTMTLEGLEDLKKETDLLEKIAEQRGKGETVEQLQKIELSTILQDEGIDKSLREQVAGVAGIAKDFESYAQSMDQRTQNEKLTASISLLSDSITKAFIGETGENVKQAIVLQDTAMAAISTEGAKLVEGAAEILGKLVDGDVENAGKIAEEIGEKLKDKLSNLFSDSTTKETMANNFKDVFDMALTRSQQFKKVLQQDENRSKEGN